MKFKIKNLICSISLLLISIILPTSIASASHISESIVEARAEARAISQISNSDDDYITIAFHANYYYDAVTGLFQWGSIDSVKYTAKSGYLYQNPSYSASLIDRGRTYSVTLTGTLVNNKDGTSKSHNLTYDFHLNASTGVITSYLW